MWRVGSLAALGLALAVAPAAAAPSTFFSTNDPDGKIGVLSQPGVGGRLETETGDDFFLNSTHAITSASFTGLLTGGATTSDVSDVVVEIYRVFPQDSDVGRTSGPPVFSTPQVPTRVNSPSDVAFASRDSAASELSFAGAVLVGGFTAGNSVVNGINPLPGVFTGGEGAVTGTEVRFTTDLATPFVLPKGHYFFVPQVAVDGGQFLWLSAPKPIVPPGTPFGVDLQAWVRNEKLAPDWLRVGTDITHAGPFNMSFSLDGEAVPEPATWSLMILGLAGMGGLLRRQRARAAAA
jgi:hypothetical protein